MDFQLDEAALRQFAQIEAEANCDIGAGFDWGQNLEDYLSQAICTVDQGKLLEILRERLGNALSPEKLEEVAHSIQAQLRHRVIEKFQSAKSA